MKISVITPCLNPGRLLDETVRSVLNQSAVRAERVALEYVIVDGGSTDGTVGYLGSFQDDPRIRWMSEPDDGLYHALSKGLRMLTGDVHCYLNAGDLYHPNAFDVVADVIGLTTGWMTGMSVIYNERGDVIHASAPPPFRRRWLQRGIYNGRVLGFVQQESTFWTGDMTSLLDLDLLAEMRLAGDAHIWSTFARHVDLTVVGAHLGGFRLHDRHLSEDLASYLDELRSVTDRPSLLDHVIARLFRLIPSELKRELRFGPAIYWDRSGKELGWLTTGRMGRRAYGIEPSPPH